MLNERLGMRAGGFGVLAALLIIGGIVTGGWILGFSGGDSLKSTAPQRLAGNNEVSLWWLPSAGNSTELLAGEVFMALFRPGSFGLSYRGKVQRLAGEQPAWFDPGDWTDITVIEEKGYSTVKLRWVNVANDPSEAGIEFSIPDEGSTISFRMFATLQAPEEADFALYGLSYSGRQYDFLAPGGSFHLNDGASLFEGDVGSAEPDEGIYGHLSDEDLNLTLRLDLTQGTRFRNSFRFEVTTVWLPGRAFGGRIEFETLELTVLPGYISSEPQPAAEAPTQRTLAVARHAPAPAPARLLPQLLRAPALSAGKVLSEQARSTRHK